MRLIDADAVHKFVVDKITEGNDGWANGVPYEWAYALAVIDSQPTIDAEPVRHGRWSVTEYEYFDCSLCGHAYFNGCDSTAEAKHKLANGDYYQFCPYCGAKMDLEE